MTRRRSTLSDSDWLARVSSILTPELQREYLQRVKAARWNAQRHAWKGERRSATAARA